MKNMFKKIAFAFKKYDMPEDATFGPKSMAAQKKKQELALLIADNAEFIRNKGKEVVVGNKVVS